MRLKHIIKLALRALPLTETGTQGFAFLIGESFRFRLGEYPPCRAVMDIPHATSFKRLKVSLFLDPNSSYPSCSVLFDKPQENSFRIVFDSENYTPPEDTLDSDLGEKISQVLDKDFTPSDIKALCDRSSGFCSFWTQVSASRLDSLDAFIWEWDNILEKANDEKQFLKQSVK